MQFDRKLVMDHWLKGSLEAQILSAVALNPYINIFYSSVTYHVKWSNFLILLDLSLVLITFFRPTLQLLNEPIVQYFFFHSLRFFIDFDYFFLTNLTVTKRTRFSINFPDFFSFSWTFRIFYLLADRYKITISSSGVFCLVYLYLTLKKAFEKNEGFFETP